ncbi:SDR family NAD(P)-dependent oxidoreductase [Sporosarcina cascadiensis]|uniref:SDR family NAD(P)-dependent oxidoreductase n=1 Tax=Sporosarcina cascadiensis TaxID=2660747 RepID=UPI001E2C65AD|nr:SDR family NAD(P)-dependent oxidoreductase [Sporosarcina cascadiensis]
MTTGEITERLLENQTAIITGASRGIGEQTAYTLAAAGADVVLNGRDEMRLYAVKERIINELGRRAVVVVGDAKDPQTAKRAVQTAIDFFGRIDILVNNAGMNSRSSTADTTLEDWQQVIDVNLNSVFYFCKEVLPFMVTQKRGKIVNVSSKASKTPHQNAAPSYGASKAGVNYLTMHLASEYAKDNIYVNAICPGPVETDMTRQWSPEYRMKVLEGMPFKKLGTPQEVARTILFFASSLSDYVTGETLNVNGGTYMN